MGVGGAVTVDGFRTSVVITMDFISRVLVAQEVSLSFLFWIYCVRVLVYFIPTDPHRGGQQCLFCLFQLLISLNY